MTSNTPPYESTFIREWREERGLSIAELAADVGMDKGNLSKLETGKHPYNQRTLEPIAKRLGVTVDTLLTRGPSDPIPFWDSYRRASSIVKRQIDAAAEAIYRESKGGN